MFCFRPARNFDQPDIFIQQIIHLIIDSESLHKDSDNLCNFNAQDKIYFLFFKRNTKTINS